MIRLYTISMNSERYISARLHCSAEFVGTTNYQRSNFVHQYSRCDHSTVSVSTLYPRHHWFRFGIRVSISVFDCFPLQLHQQHQVHHHRKGTPIEGNDENYGTTFGIALDRMVKNEFLSLKNQIKGKPIGVTTLGSQSVCCFK